MDGYRTTWDPRHRNFRPITTLQRPVPRGLRIGTAHYVVP
jgi:hypothetical protein